MAQINIMLTLAILFLSRKYIKSEEYNSYKCILIYGTYLKNRFNIKHKNINKIIINLLIKKLF